jgi:hypothetical protein
MAGMKFDGVVEAVHYAPDGQVEWVRVYERRGSSFSDRLIYNRKTFVEKLKTGRKYVAGQRIPFVASTFDILWPVILVKNKNHEYISTADEADGRDILAGVPVI